MRKIILAVVTLALFIYLFINTSFGALIMSAPVFEFLADYDTEYTPGFSIERYVQVEDGMSKKEVLKILGEPFPEYDDNTCFHYSRGKPIEKRIQRFGDIYFHSYQVCFGNSGKVFLRDWGQIFYN